MHVYDPYPRCPGPRQPWLTEDRAMGYCWTCGWHTDAMTPPADLDPRTRMCRWCRDHWRPSEPAPADLGTRHPEPLAG